MAFLAIFGVHTVLAQQVVPGEYIVKYNSSGFARLKNYSTTLSALSDGELRTAVRHAMNFKKRKSLKLINGEVVKVASGGALAKDNISIFVAAGVVDFVEPNYLYSISATTPNDPSFSSMWGLNNTGQDGGTANFDIDAPQAWDTTTGSNTVVVGVLDSGVAYNHEDLHDNMWVNSGEIANNGVDDDGNGVIDDVYGFNAYANNGNPNDDLFHGTHCAGIIAARGNNGIGVTGVAWNVKIMALKFIASNGLGSTSDAIEAINYAVMMKQRGVNLRILSNSWGSYGYSSALQSAITTANSAGILFVAAAGNDSNNNDTTPIYPAGYNVANVISVAAVNNTGHLASFSNYGRTSVDIGAPGEDILSTLPNNTYGLLSGTSMATPFVSGVAALALSVDSSLSPSELKTLLMNNTKALSSLTTKTVSGGLVDAADVLDAISGGGGGGSGGGFSGNPADPGDQAGFVGDNGPDADGDGVTDSQETTDGTSLSDPGSFKTHLTTPIFVLWNGYLSMTNILELVNPSDSDTSVTIYFYSQNGDLRSQQAVTVGANSQYDVIVNDISGFLPDQYGLIKLSFSGTLEGRIFYYSPSSDGVSYNFAYGIPFANATYGTSAVSFNTYQPSENSADSGLVVANWLSVVNLATVTKEFTVNTYDYDGNVVASQNLSIEPKGRQDIDGGHGLLGPSHVGVHVIIPSDETAPYQALLIRYGSSATPNVYQFAFPLIAKAGNGRPAYLPISSQFGEDDWVELVNTRDSATNVSISFRNSEGTVLSTESLTLAAHAQHHFLASALLPSGDVGYAVITPSSANSIIAQTMCYFRASSGSILAMYGIQSREALGKSLTGSYNLFLSMNDELRLVNTSSSSIDSTLIVTGPSGSTTVPVTLGAHETSTYNLGDTATYGTAADTYGFVSVEVPVDHAVIADILRLRTANSAIDFVAPTAVR